MSAPLLEIRDLVVSFDGFRAIDGVDFTIREGEVRFLIGPNGAGKTTLVDAVTGLSPVSEGSIHFAGSSLAGLKEFQVVRQGIGRTFQNPSVFEELTVGENVDLAAGFRRPLRYLLRQSRGLSAEVRAALATVGLEAVADRLAGVLSHGQKQWLEIAMLLVQDPRLLMLDEPVAGMSKDERTRTGELLHEIAATRTVLVIEHDMDFLRRFASGVTVMNEGKVLCEGSVAEVQADPRVQEVYLGRGHAEAPAAEQLDAVG